MRQLVVALLAAGFAIESLAVVCNDCKARSNPGAKYCFNCGKKLPPPANANEEYEALLREAMPFMLAMDRTAEKDVGVKTEEMIRKEMARFRAMDAAGQKRELKTAREAIAKVRQAGGTSEGGLSRAVAAATESSNASAMSMRGRNLFVGIIQANTEREAAGLETVWPKAAVSKDDDPEDISGMLFANSTDYFRALFDMKNFGKEEWSPYVAGVDRENVFPKGSSAAQWIVAKGVLDEMPDCVPVLLSSNVDVSSLVTRPGSYKGRKIEGSLRFSGEWAVAICKGGAAMVIKRKDAALSKVYSKQDFVIPEGFGYLKP